jgi:hypothetical protein
MKGMNLSKRMTSRDTRFTTLPARVITAMTMK